MPEKIDQLLRDVAYSLRAAESNLRETRRILGKVWKDIAPSYMDPDLRRELEEGFETSYCARCGKQDCTGGCHA